ncbi:carboxypeptidase-like regulatory domain-containing protein [Flavobacterium sp.]|jgi:hypothetical protein|uniref:carboxypeptidase-like regulatory domain-containing protein n=1 Tax=Flavobacterium sp. TaxID=239 RepID=UPI0037C16A88
MKFKITLLLLLFLSTTTFAQLISGQILNETTKEPIFGVTISSNGMPYAFSDQDGKFEIDDSSTIKELTFSHLGFIEYKVKLENFNKESTIIYLKEKMIFLDEVVISKDKNALTLEDIIKKSSRKFNESYKTTPYLSNVNTKQVVMQNNDYIGYVELDGILYNFVPKDNNPFWNAFILPNQSRKNFEITELSDYASKNKLPFNIISPDLLKGSFLDLQFSNLSHPLFKKQKYTYKQLEDVVINEKVCYKIQFSQKRGIHIKRDLFNVYGEMLISKDDYSIMQHNVSFDFDDIKSNEIEVVYESKNNEILPSTIVISSKIINPKYKRKGVFTETHIKIDNSNATETVDVTKKLTFNFNFYLDELKYNPNYWKQKNTLPSTPLIDNYLKSITPQDFEEGAKQKLLDTKSKYYTAWHENFRLEQIKLHQETLKNIKL